MNRSRAVLLVLGLVLISAALHVRGRVERSEIPKYYGPELSKPNTIAGVGEAVVSVTLSDLNGREFVLGGDSSSPTLVHFWASWCSPCLAELPSIEASYPEFEKLGVRFLSVAQDTKHRAERVLSKYDVTFPVLLAEGAQVDALVAFGSPMGALPFNVLLDEHGRVLFQKTGVVSAEELLEMLKANLPPGSGG